jgi:hypothetical protein
MGSDELIRLQVNAALVMGMQVDGNVHPRVELRCAVHRKKFVIS